jgi:LAO/AO transport system kinase
VAHELAERLLAGERRALARAITQVEDGTASGRQLLSEIYAQTGRARTIGITGGAGSGKSTLTGALAREYRGQGKTVGIVAVDPSSPFSHGAILGDRIRMQDLTSDPEIYVRSMATRGSLGGLSAAAADVVAVIDAAGKDVILVETVGAGQDEVEIASTAQTTILVNNPGTGDDIQAMKAGIVEIADILVVSKGDLPGADVLASQLRALMSYATEHGDYIIPVHKVMALKGQGVSELIDLIDAHGEYLRSSGELERQERKVARHRVLSIARNELLQRVVRSTSESGLDDLIERVARRELDPHSAADELVSRLAG